MILHLLRSSFRPAMCDARSFAVPSIAAAQPTKPRLVRLQRDAAEGFTSPGHSFRLTRAW